MNRRIKKKRNKILGDTFSSYRRRKVSLKRAHRIGIETRHTIRGLIPCENAYAMFLKRRRTLGRCSNESASVVNGILMHVDSVNDRRII